MFLLEQAEAAAVMVVLAEGLLLQVMLQRQDRITLL
jgi:hypothetical protein